MEDVKTGEYHASAGTDRDGAMPDGAGGAGSCEDDGTQATGMLEAEAGTRAGADDSDGIDFDFTDSEFGADDDTGEQANAGDALGHPAADTDGSERSS